METDDLVRALRELLPLATDPTDPPAVLALGDGAGEWAFWLAAHGYATTMVAPSAEVDAARRAMAELPFSVQNRIERLSVGDARDLSRFPDAAFDAVLALGTPSPDDPDGAREIRRVLKPGGRLVTSPALMNESV